MATEINRAPVLTGKAAKEFWKSVENFKDDTPVQEIREGLLRFREFMSKQKHFHQYV